MIPQLPPDASLATALGQTLDMVEVARQQRETDTEFALKLIRILKGMGDMGMFDTEVLPTILRRPAENFLTMLASVVGTTQAPAVRTIILRSAYFALWYAADVYEREIAMCAQDDPCPWCGRAASPQLVELELT